MWPVLAVTSHPFGVSARWSCKPCALCTCTVRIGPLRCPCDCAKCHPITIMSMILSETC